jgi:urea carboxylase
VPPFYDPMVAKIIVKAATAPKRWQNAAGAGRYPRRRHRDQPRLPAPDLRDAVFAEGRQTTRYLNAFHYRPATIDVIEPGVQSSIQDWPGRTGYWDVGVPPSGPMDALAFRLANRLAATKKARPALELTVAGPTLRFNCDA